MTVPKSETYKGYKITVDTKQTVDGTFIGKKTITPQTVREVVGSKPFEIGEYLPYDTKLDPVIDLFRIAEAEIDRWLKDRDVT